MSEKVGFIGLGAIGRPMAGHIAKALETQVWNRTTERAESFAKEHEADVAASPADLVSWADVVITCLPTSADVDSVVRAPDVVWREGQLLIDATSGDPAEARALAEWLAQHGVGFVDAPVSGGTVGAEAGKLTVMLGGEANHVERATQIIEPYSGKIRHVGPVGAGDALKAINNALLAVNILAVGEGLAALVKLGVTGETALEVINAATGYSNVSINLIPERVLTRAWPRTFRLALLDKDLGVALKMLQDTGVPHDAIGVAKEAFGRARATLGEEADHVELIKEIEKAAGVEIK